MRHLWMLLLGGCTGAAYGRAAFERHIVTLASDDMKGRDNDTAEGLRAAQYVADQFAAAGLKPAFHDFETRWSPRSEKVIRGRNVYAVLRGSDLAQECVVVAAHHDARGVVGGRIQNGADDNASGVAMVLELARAFARKPARRSLVFVSFDAEEDGMLGSREFVGAKVQDPASVAAMFVFDLIGGNFVPWEDRSVYALGSEYSGELRERVGRMAAAERALDVRRLGVYSIEALSPRSDYGAYRAARVPFVFFSTATPWYYHTEHDDPDVINYEKLTRAASFVERVIRETADDPQRPVFIARPAPDYRHDARMLKEGGEAMLKSELFHLTGDQRKTLEKCIGQLDAIIAEPPEDARARIQGAMVAYFGIVMSQRPR